MAREVRPDRGTPVDVSNDLINCLIFLFLNYIYLLILCVRTPTAHVVKARGQLEGLDSLPCHAGPGDPGQDFRCSSNRYLY